MSLSFSKRIVGYGAWNLHFDRLLGATAATNNLTFLSYLRSLGYHQINHIKVVLFRNSTIEGLPADRALTLYRRDGTINQALIDNLKRLVNEAAAKGFWVQLCIWHHHAIAREDRSEYPENAPGVLAPDWSIARDGDRLAKYYAPSASRQAAFEEHRKLFRKIGAEFGAYSNVLFELGNELRVWQSHGTAEQWGDERNLRGWLAMMADALRSAAPNPIRVGVSTGIENEHPMFNPPVGLNVDFYDFHAGQWNMSNKYDNDYPIGMRQSRERVQNYKPGAKLLIDTDGLFGGESLSTSATFAQYMEKWAAEAFRRGESFITKGYYPPGVAISRPMLDALERAARAVSDADAA
jgi:hypothetical protein